MPTTTIRLTDEIKTRVAAAAKRSGVTAHAFILDAIAEKTANESLRANFDAEAESRYARIAATGKTIPWQEMRDWLEKHLDGTSVAKPGPHPVG